ncbi:MAG: Ig-like domain-containing protein [Anaerolineales bacterium]|nr:Ig-like domain-containing protein [Anaerolineales bacterium]MDX9935808.1 choice-of-anchor Q domain-containing protein [Anaerolineales bacterium]GER79729.1 conserved hypothetical protein [Candidatus Denitrolinea symbiosum]
MTVTNSALSGNSADDGGGGIYSDNYSTVTVTNSALSNNSAGYGGGIYSNNYSTVTVTNSALSGNSATYSSGGGIFNYYQSTLTVTNSTLSGNSATYSNGGGIHNAYSGTLTVTNSTLSGNSANNFGGGIYNNLLATMNYSNTIIANSAAGGDCFNGGTIGANVNNLVENGSCSPTFSGDPNLGPLQDNGGPTQTHALLAGSAAIDAGNAAVCAAAPVNNLDQRGVARPQGAACDIGAYEYVDITPPVVMSITRANTNPTNAASVNFTVTFSEAVTGVDAGDFDLTTTGVTGASVASVSSSGAAYTVTVNTGTGNGTIRLDVSASSDIKDLANNALSGLPYASGEEYTIDKTAPTVTSILRADANPTNAASVNFTVTFSEAVTGVDAGDFALTATGSISGASITSVSDSGATYTVTVNTGTGNGTIRLDVSASSDIKDSSGNGLDGLPYEGGEIYAVVKFNHCYVDINANGLNNGSSWDDAYSDLQDALAENACTEIWAAAGTYYPTSGGDRAISFNLKSGVKIYGGFAGTESNLSERDVTANLTILSGDIGTQGDKGDNSYHVVYANNVNNTAVLDGFTVTGGNANGGWSNNNGGGMYNNNSSPTLTNVAFSANSANSGGGMYNNAGSSTLTDVAFSANSADDYGGGMFNSNGSPELTGVSFNNNSSPRGGGMYNDSSSPTLTDVTFSGNAATFGGGMFNLKSSPSLTKVTFSGNNTTAAGGGMYNWDNSSPELTNVTFSDNSASYGGGMVNSASSSTLTNVLLANSTGSNCANDDGGSINSSSRHNLIDDNTCGLTDGVNGNKIGPGYNANLGPLANNGGFTQTHALLAGSAAIDAGDDAACPATDQRGVARPQGAHCDIGAYEYVDNDAPTVVSITRANANPTSALSADFTVTFSEDVTGVDQSDFTLTKTRNLSGFSVASVTPADARTYTVAVTVGSGNGSLRLDVSAASDIKDLNNNLLLNLPYIDGETYTVRRRLFVRSAGAQDGWTLESFETSNAGGTFNSTAITLLLGDDAVNRQYRSILSFNTASLPDNAVITKVTLKVRLQKIVGGGNPVNALQGFMADVRKGVFGTSALQVIDFQAPASKTVGPLKPALVGGWYTLNLTPAKASVNKLATGSGLTQIRLRFKLDDNNNAVANYLSLYSGNAAVGARPQLIVEYYVP